MKPCLYQLLDMQWVASHASGQAADNFCQVSLKVSNKNGGSHSFVTLVTTGVVDHKNGKCSFMCYNHSFEPVPVF